MPPLRRLLLGFVAGAIVAITATSSRAGSIGFRTDAEVSSASGIDAKVTLTHTGDEAADDVSVTAELLDRTMDGDQVASMRPGQTHVWNFHLFDEVPKGVYVIVLTTRYADANGYPFEVVSTANVTVGVPPGPRLTGTLDVPRLGTGDEVTARLLVKKPPERSGDFDVRLVAPSGLEVKPSKLALTFDSSGKATATFRVRNLKLLSGTSVNIFSFIRGMNAGAPQVDTIRGSVRIANNDTPRFTPPMFYQAAAAVFALLLLLEAVAWARSARRDEGPRS